MSGSAVPGTRSADIQRFPAIEALPADAGGLWTGGEGVFATRAWWRVVETAGLPPGAAPVYLLCRLGGRPVALFPLLRSASGAWSSLTTPYSCLYTPLLAAGLTAPERSAVFAAFAGALRGSVRLDTLPAEWPDLPALIAACRRAGRVPLRFDHFGNWHEPVAGLDWPAYLAARPGALRETIRRRLRRAERQPEAAFRLIDSPAGLDDGIAAFEAIYARSWKEPEPFPAFNATLMRALAPLGQLRLGIWSIGGTGVATQLWVVEHGRATVLKLAHDEAFKAHSPGTVLSALMLRHILTHDRPAEIDYGRGDDDYKQGWARQRRQRIELLVVNPWRPAGMAAMVRHALGRMLRRGG
jgi:CelD/BcsL family acetyltransferase involved in cellulose biosynthesis